MSHSYPHLSRKLVKEAFHDSWLQQSIWGQRWGIDNPVGQIQRVLMHKPGKELAVLHEAADKIEAGPLLLNRMKRNSASDRPSPLPDLERVHAQHAALVRALEQNGATVDFADAADRTDWPERIFTRDWGMIVPGGVILSRFALYIRHGETPIAAQAFAGIGIPMIGMVQGHGFAEGGSFIMLEPATAVIGRSERVNPEGIHQIRQLLAFQGIELIVVDLPASIIHLDEAFLMIDRHRALVNIALLPFWFLEELDRRGIEMLHVDPRDPPLTINGLAVAPGRVLFAEGGAYTMDLLARNNVEVIPVDVSEIQKLGGGIHCCTLPLKRAALQ
ncbi:dimethylarginine dimethylaminohydrolase family protein [Paenibacillus xanthanilyticus]|uniref:Dimethylarginine dimethylaminohydrolase family protein n=1 Tax=Paenibacillus xanthanilyticus TaxID=1783531 RepID=A0ABV8K983_9BACL